MSMYGQSNQWGEWGDWIWSDEHQRYYHQRQDIYGQIDTEWGPNQSSSEVPRDASSSLEDITEGLANASLQSPGSVNYDYSQDYSVESGSVARPKGKSKASRHHKTGRKGKQRASPDPDDGDETETEYDPSARQDIPTEYRTDGAQYPYSPNAQYNYGTNAYHQAGMADPGYATQGIDPEQDEADDLRQAMEASRLQNYGVAQAGQSSSDAYYMHEEEVETTPAQPTDGHIAATGGEYEELDPRYRIEHSNRFQPGEIFKVLWSEPQGTGADQTGSLVSQEEMRDKFGGKFFVGFRRFVVVGNDLGHCTCVPILTYGGKACNKRGVKAEKHGIIYERGTKPRLLSHEPKLGFIPVKVEMTEPGEKLAKESRVNYSKLVTVEHNVKVLFIGHVAPADWDTVSEAVNYCWEQKSRYKRKHR